MFRTVSDLHPIESRIHPFHPFLDRNTCIQQRKFHILKDRQFVYQVKTLKNKTDISVPQVRTAIFRILGNFLSEKPQLAVRRVIQQSQEIQ